jgi:hypothetical protein
MDYFSVLTSRTSLTVKYVGLCTRFKSGFLLLLLLSSGPRAYAPDAPQTVGPLCYPSVLDVPSFAASPSPCPCYPRDP